MIALCCKADLGRRHPLLPARQTATPVRARPTRTPLFFEVVCRWALAAGLLVVAALVLVAALVMVTALTVMPSRLRSRSVP